MNTSEKQLLARLAGLDELKDHTRIRQYFEEIAVRYEKESRNYKAMNILTDQKTRHDYFSRCSRLADRFHDVAMAIAIFASVTVSIAALMNGMFTLILVVNRLLMSASSGKKSAY